MKALKYAALGLVLATPLQARVPINEEPHIVGTLLQGFVADQITDHCPHMKARKLRALNELTKLRDYALDKGYSSVEVRRFVESKAEKARGKAEAAAWLKERGAVPGKSAVYCQIGAEEISKKSLIGRLLRATK